MQCCRSQISRRSIQNSKMWKTIALVGLSLLWSTCPAKGQDQFENCQFLGESGNTLQVSWTLRRSDAEIDIQLCGCTGNNEYMGFGLSGNDSRTLMRGADPTIAYVDDDMGPMAIDYYLSDYVQCVNGNGACPDTLDSNSCPDNVRNVSGSKREGFQCVAYTRSFVSADTTCDRPLNPDEPQFIVWAVGGIGETAFVHFRRANSGDDPIDFGRAPSDQCSSNGGLICSTCDPFEEVVIDARGRNETFVGNIGPPGGARGYMAITGQAGWGISWYINGTLIPRIMVERGYTYTFLSEGGGEGDGPDFHPFYLSDSRVGGFLTKTEAQQMAEVVYAGFDENGNPIGVGPYCAIADNAAATNILNTCGSQEDYMQSLERRPCSSPAAPGGFSWTPDETTPDTVYYQCATHRNLGYEITVSGSRNAVLAYAITIVLMAALTFAL